MNVDLRLRLHEGSSAAKGIANRTGVGKVRHIETNQLWVQDKVREKKIEIIKVKGTDNIADPLTKHVDCRSIEKNLRETECRISVGRHELMPEIDDNVTCLVPKES